VNYTDLNEAEDVDQAAELPPSVRKTINVTLINATAQEAHKVMIEAGVAEQEPALVMYDFQQGLLKDGGLHFNDFIAPMEMAAQVTGMMKMCKAGHEMNSFSWISMQQRQEAEKALRDQVCVGVLQKGDASITLFFLLVG
jgi:hypothetical protein